MRRQQDLQGLRGGLKGCMDEGSISSYEQVYSVGFLWLQLIHIFALSPQVSIVDTCRVHTAVGSEFSQLWSMESGLFDVVFIMLRPTRDDLFSGLESLTLIALLCDPKLNPAGQQTTKHDGLYSLLSVLLTMPPIVERFQQCDDPYCIGFYALAFLFVGFHEWVVHTSFWLSNVASLAISCITCRILHHAQIGQNA